MKIISISLLAVMSIWFSLTSSTNSISLTMTKGGKKSAALYDLSINLSSELTTQGRIGAISWSESITDEQTERMKKTAETKCSEKVGADVKCVYRLNKKGKKLSTLGNDNIAGMPTDSFKNTLENNEDELFVSIQIHMTNDGKPLKVGKKKSRIQPKVSGLIRVFDREKNIVHKGKWSQNLLDGILELNDKDDNLSPEDIEVLYDYALENLINAI